MKEAIMYRVGTDLLHCDHALLIREKSLPETISLEQCLDVAEENQSMLKMLESRVDKQDNQLREQRQLLIQVMQAKQPASAPLDDLDDVLVVSLYGMKVSIQY
jgi:hypothetical protein